MRVNYSYKPLRVGFGIQRRNGTTVCACADKASAEIITNALNAADPVTENYYYRRIEKPGQGCRVIICYEVLFNEGEGDTFICHCDDIEKADAVTKALNFFANFDKSQVEISIPKEDKTARNLELIGSFCEYVKNSFDIEITEPQMISFFELD